MGSGFIALFFLLKNNRKKEKQMNNSIKRLLLPLLIAAAAVITSACADEGGTGTVTPPESGTAVTETAKVTGEADTRRPEDTKETGGAWVTAAQTPEESGEGLWAGAKYTEDTEVGEGKIAIKVKVTAGDKAVTITVRTNNEHLGGALVENDLVTGDESEYGLFIKSVNGILADYDKDQAWWAISKDGEMLMTGADSTPIADGESYELTYTKG